MPHIQQLDSHVADLIAAGEVVERPASVVKELMENAIDAGADKLTVEIQHGGMTLIRVTDNGCGIEAHEAPTAFLRHATSKLRTEYDLEAIGTLGFRGEALAAISAVSRVELLTRTNHSPLGAALSLEGGVLVDQQEAGCPQGTTMVVKDLFYNTPARLKFMKKDSAESAACFAMVQRLALSHPEVSIKFLRDGKQDLLTPGDGQLKSALYAVLGRDLALGFTPVKGSGEDMTVTGFVSLPTCCRGSRGYQHFFVNGRYVKSRTMMAALEEAYANQKMVGRFPGCVLHLQTKLNAVDVNVHPTKQEVKFGSDKKVFDAVYYAVKSTLEADRSRPSALGDSPRLAPKAAQDTVTPHQTTFRTTTAEPPRKAEVKPAPSLPLRDFAARPAQTAQPVRATTRVAPTVEKQPTSTIPPVEPQAPIQPEPEAGPPPEPSASGSGGERRRSGESELCRERQSEGYTACADEIPWRMAGEVLNTYIIVEQGDTVLFIDKHAAHERMNFDRMKAAGYDPMAQTLLTPALCRLSAPEHQVLLDHQGLLEEFGFEVDELGSDLAVRQAPFDVAVEDIPATLEEIAQKLLTTGSADPAAARDELLHTMACKAAIKGGWHTSPQELERVAQAVMSGQVKYCPHGRPVAIQLTKKELEKQFKRA